MVFICCNERITDEYQFDLHFKGVHFKFEKCSNFKCLVQLNPVEHCHQPVTNRYALKRHFYRYHYELVKDVFSQKTLSSLGKSVGQSLEEQPDPINQLGSDFEDDEPDREQSVSTNQIIDFINDSEMGQGLDIQGEELLCPPDFSLSNEISELLIFAKNQLKMTESSIVKFLKSYNQILLKSSSSPSIDKSIIKIINEFTKSPYKIRKTILALTGTGSNFECHEIFDENRSLFYYCPILGPIKKFISNPRLLSVLMSEHNREVDPNLLKTFKDGKLYSRMQHRPDHLELLLQLFTDDISLRIRGFHNEILVGGSFENIPLQFMSKKNNMFLVLAAKRKDVKNSMNLRHLFAPLLREIESINSNNLEVIDPFSQGKYILKVRLVTNIGDNKAMHELLGIPPANSRCRDCLITHSRLNKKDLPFVTHFETRRLDPACHIFDGILDSISNYPRDKFHDNAEGTCHKVLTPVLKHFYFNQTNVLVDKTKLFKQWRNGRIEGISDYRVKGTGMQVLEFFLLFPILDDRIERTSDWFKLIILLREIILFISCDVVARNELDDFHRKVQDFQKLYFELLTSREIESFTMKLHYLIHYKNCIEESGPMNAHDATRGERFLKTIKDVVSNSKNTKNLIFTIVKNHQLYLQPHLFNNEDNFVLTTLIPAAEIQIRLPPVFLPFIDLNSDLEELSSANVLNIAIKLNSVYILGYESRNGHPIFIKLVKLFKQNNFLKLVGQVLRVVRYYDLDCYYQVNNTGRLELLDLSRLAWHNDLYYQENVNDTGCNVIVKDFKSKASFHVNQEFRRLE